MARTKDDLATYHRVARHGRLSYSNSWVNALKIFVTSILVVAVSGASVAAYAVWGLAEDARTVDLDARTEAPQVGINEESLSGALTVLLVGTDYRDPESVMYDGEEGVRNDVNLLLHVPADHQSATVISFPRDLMVPIPSCTDAETGEIYSSMSEQQINSAMFYGGLACVALTITELTGIDIPYAAAVDFDGVIGISHAIGGVNVCLAQPIEDTETGLMLPAGEVNLAGVEALNFLRTRYGVGDGSDLSRISNQQVFMSALLRQLRSSETLSNPIKVYGLAKVGIENLTLSSSMASLEFLRAFAGTFVDIDLARINFVQYPTRSHPYHPGRLLPDRFSGDQLIEVTLSGQPFQVHVSEVVVSPDAEHVEQGELGTADIADERDEAAGVDGGDDPQADERVGSNERGSAGLSVLPENVTGQSANVETCSAGRTQY